MRAPERTFVRAQSLRRSMSLPEVILWQHLRGQRLGGLRFRRQHPVGPYVLDFYCAAAGLAVEVDGRSHESRERARHDAARAAWLAEHGIRQLRLPAPDILDPARRVFALEAIVLAAGAPSTGFAGPPPRKRGRIAPPPPSAVPSVGMTAPLHRLFGGPPPPRCGGV